MSVHLWTISIGAFAEREGTVPAISAASADPALGAGHRAARQQPGNLAAWLAAGSNDVGWQVICRIVHDTGRGAGCQELRAGEFPLSGRNCLRSRQFAVSPTVHNTKNQLTDKPESVAECFEGAESMQGNYEMSWTIPYEGQKSGDPDMPCAEITNRPGSAAKDVRCWAVRDSINFLPCDYSSCFFCRPERQWSCCNQCKMSGTGCLARLFRLAFIDAHGHCNQGARGHPHRN